MIFLKLNVTENGEAMPQFGNCTFKVEACCIAF